MKNKKYWKSKSGKISLDRNSIIGYKYWPRNTESVGFTWGGLDIILTGGTVKISLDDGGEELYNLLKNEK